MPLGPGKYDAICTVVREETNAQAAIVIIIGGNKGTGFSCQSAGGPLQDLPEILETVARQMRESMKDIDGN